MFSLFSHFLIFPNRHPRNFKLGIWNINLGRYKGEFRPIILNNYILRYELKGEVRTRPKIFTVVLGPCVQVGPGEASEQKWGQEPKSKPNESRDITLILSSFDSSRKNKQFKKRTSKSEKNDGFMLIARESGSWPILVFWA